MKSCCDMKGFLSFIVLKIISKQESSGEDIRKEIEKRKGTKPSPGTIYPVLKALKKQGWISETETNNKEKKYKLTLTGRREVRLATKRFVEIFCDMQDEFKKQRK